MIKGLTDRPAAFPTIGTLRKGAPKPQNGNKPGADLKHFRFDTEDQEAHKLFTEHYGAEPRAIRVFVPFKTAQENFEAWKEEWTASSLKHRCDGHTMVLWLDKENAFRNDPKPCPGGCKQVGRLSVIIPELKRMAFVTVLTTSIHDIMEIHSNLLALESARGDLRGIPLILKRTPRKISTPREGGQRARAEKWLITIEAQPQWVELQLAAQEREALPQAEPLALPAWDGDDEEDDQADPRQQIINQMRQIFEDQDRSASWPAYEKKHVDNQSVDRCKVLLFELEARASKALVEQIEGPLFNALKAAGVSGQEVTEKVAQIAGGECAVEQMDYATLVSVRDGLEGWLGQLKKEAAKAA
jgi:hypothetical protein